MNNKYLSGQFGSLVLASSSPRRAQILSQVGFIFDVFPSHIDEHSEHQEPVKYAMDLAHKKCAEISKKYEDRIVLAADTIVCIAGQILEKPASPADAHAMLRLLSGKTHQVYTAFALRQERRGLSVTDVDKTDVTFRSLTDGEIARYIESGSPFDKAGAYGIQDASALFVERIDGDFYNVVGLPIAKIYDTLCRDFVI